MRKLLIPLLLFSMIVTGCTSNQDAIQQDQPSLSERATNGQQTTQSQSAQVTQQTQSTNDVFAKKEDCVKYQRQMEQDIEKFNYKKQDSAFPGSFNISTATIDEIFYSPTRNSCMYIMNIENSFKLHDTSPNLRGKDYDEISKNLVDFFTKERPFSTITYCKQNGEDCPPADREGNGVLNKYDFEKKIQELK